MIFTINVIKEESADPDFKVNVSISGDGMCIKNAQVNVLRVPPKMSFHYPKEISESLCKMDQKKLELEILNEIAECII